MVHLNSLWQVDFGFQTDVYGLSVESTRPVINWVSQ